MLAHELTAYLPSNAPDRVLILRTCSRDMTSHGGFQWPASGPIEAPDWRDDATCGHGLHGWLDGEGDGGLGNWDADARWLVASVLKADVRDLTGKVKFPRCVVILAADRAVAAAFLRDHGTPGKAVIGSTFTGGNRSTFTGGDGSTFTGVWYDQNRRRRLSVAYVGEEGILPDIAYHINDTGQFVACPIT
jgi:hypothetical protein